MATFDLPLHELERYLPDRSEPRDFDDFWGKTLIEARSYPLEPKFELADYGIRSVDVFDVTYKGFEGTEVKGWLLLPRNINEPLPCVVEYIGYGGGRGYPFDWLIWSSLGYAHLVMDTRGQGSTWRKGDTSDVYANMEVNPHFPGFMTLGILNPKDYYYRRLIVDAVRAVDVARHHQSIDQNKIVVTGGSQGGGLSIAVAGLDQNVSATMPDVPFLCNFRRATEITDQLPYKEISNYCKARPNDIETIFTTLAYFDGMNFAVRAKAKSIFSVALMDMVCPPSTVYAAYNHYAGSKTIRIWTYSSHEGGESHQIIEKIKFLKEHFERN